MCSIALKEVEVHSSGTAGKRPTMDLNEAARACGCCDSKLGNPSKVAICSLKRCPKCPSVLKVLLLDKPYMHNNTLVTATYSYNYHVTIIGVEFRGGVAKFMKATIGYVITEAIRSCTYACAQFWAPAQKLLVAFWL